LFVPNAFVPGTNVGKFSPSGNGLRSYRIEIYDVTNEKMWESRALEAGQPSEGWDGYFQGTLQPAGKYYYKIQAVFENGAEWKGVDVNGTYTKTGTFYLVNEQ